MCSATAPVAAGQDREQRPQEHDGEPVPEPDRPVPCRDGARSRAALSSPARPCGPAGRAHILPSAGPGVERGWQDRPRGRRSRRWCLVLPVKRLAVAKTRLGPPYAGEQARAGARLRAGHGRGRAGLSARGRRPGGHRRARGGRGAGGGRRGGRPATQPDAGLNPALAHGAALAPPGPPRHLASAPWPRTCRRCGRRELAAALRSGGAARPQLRPGRRGHRDDAAAVPARPATCGRCSAPARRPGTPAPARHEVDRGALRRCAATSTPPRTCDAAAALGVGPWTAGLLAGRPLRRGRQPAGYRRAG